MVSLVTLTISCPMRSFKRLRTSSMSWSILVSSARNSKFLLRNKPWRFRDLSIDIEDEWEARGAWLTYSSVAELSKLALIRPRSSREHTRISANQFWHSKDSSSWTNGHEDL